MASAEIVIATPAWDRSWALPLWFESVRANVDPKRTGLAFVVPAADNPTRDAIRDLSEGFAFVEVLRDRGEQQRRQERPETAHETLAVARNQLLRLAAEVRPRHYLSWDTDFLVPEGAVDELRSKNLPLVTAWSWLNRQDPQLIRHFDGQEYHEVWWQPPVCATGMAWDPTRKGRALHYPSHEFELRARGTWQCDVALAFQLMDARAYTRSSYSPHTDGEDVSFNYRLASRGVPRFCCGDITGVHLYDRVAAHERHLGWPGVMKLAKQRPLAATWTLPRSVEYECFGFFPKRDIVTNASSELSSVDDSA